MLVLRQYTASFGIFHVTPTPVVSVPIKDKIIRAGKGWIESFKIPSCSYFRKRLTNECLARSPFKPDAWCPSIWASTQKNSWLCCWTGPLDRGGRVAAFLVVWDGNCNAATTMYALKDFNTRYTISRALSGFLKDCFLLISNIEAINCGQRCDGGRKRTSYEGIILIFISDLLFAEDMMLRPNMGLTK